MRASKRIFHLLLAAGTLFLASPLKAAETADPSTPIDPQSPQAIQQMADQLEADRKARETDAKEKREAAAGSDQQGSGSGQGASSGSISAGELQALKQQCEDARQALIEPLRTDAINECIAKKVKSPEQCEKFYQDYGEAGVTESGGFRQRRFHDIPECQRFYEAQKKANVK